MAGEKEEVLRMGGGDGDDVRSQASNYSSEDEGTEDYRNHAVRVGDSFKNGCYVVQSELGRGNFSTVWLAWDTQKSRYVALKVQKSDQHYKTAMGEIKILKQVTEGDPDDKKCVVKLLDHFKHSGPNGQHVCLVFELLGDNLLTLITYRDHRGVPLHMVKEICYHVLVALDYLHRQLCIIHADLKLENILLLSTIDPSRDPRKLGAPLILPAREDRVVAVSAGLREERSSNGDLTRNQKKKIRKKAKKAALVVGGVTNGVSDEAEESSKDFGPGNSENCEINGDADDSLVEQSRDCSRKEDMAKTEQAKIENQAKKGHRRVSRDTREKLVGEVDLKCKLVDFGYACWTDKQFTNNIQSGSYRCPELILGSENSTSGDLWSFACICFELATGDVLFDSHSGENYDRDEDHLALVMELLGMMPLEVAMGAPYSRYFFNRYGDLRHIQELRFLPLNKVLMENYNFSEQDANDMADFLIPILDFVPDKRPTAAQCLAHPWISAGPHQLQPSTPSLEDCATEEKTKEKADREAMEARLG